MVAVEFAPSSLSKHIQKQEKAEQNPIDVKLVLIFFGGFSTKSLK